MAYQDLKWMANRLMDCTGGRPSLWLLALKCTTHLLNHTASPNLSSSSSSCCCHCQFHSFFHCPTLLNSVLLNIRLIMMNPKMKKALDLFHKLVCHAFSKFHFILTLSLIHCCVIAITSQLFSFAHYSFTALCCFDSFW